jgi:hypothetical protein
MKRSPPRPKDDPTKFSQPDADDMDIIDSDNESPFEVTSFLSDLKGGSEQADYTVMLYRLAVISGRPGKRTRFFVYQWENECPTQKEIGEEYGSGNYYLYVVWLDSKGIRHQKSVTVNIDSHYDKLKEEKEKAKEKPQTPSEGINGGNAIMQGIFMMKALTEAIKPLFESFRGTSAPAAVPAAPDVLAKNIENMMEMQNKAMMKNFEMGFDMQKKMMENMGNNQSNDGDDEENGMMERLLNIVEKFMPLLRSLPEKSIGQVVETAKQDEQLKAILADPAQTRIFYSKLVEKHGEKEAAEIAGKFGIKGMKILPTSKKVK